MCALDSKTSRNDCELILGAWEVVQAESSGESNIPCIGKIDVFDKRSYWWTIPGKVTSNLFRYRIDPEATPGATAGLPSSATLEPDTAGQASSGTRRIAS